MQDWRSLIRSYRRKSGLSQAALAERLNVDPTTVSRWERGVSQPERALQQLLKDLARDGDANQKGLLLATQHNRLPIGLLDADCQWIAVSEGRCAAVGQSESDIIGSDARNFMGPTASETLTAFLEDRYYAKDDLVYAEFFAGYEHTLPTGLVVPMLIRETCELVHESGKLAYVRATSEIIDPSFDGDLIERGVFIDGTVGTNVYGQAQTWC